MQDITFVITITIITLIIIVIDMLISSIEKIFRASVGRIDQQSVYTNQLLSVFLYLFSILLTSILFKLKREGTLTVTMTLAATIHER